MAGAGPKPPVKAERMRNFRLPEVVDADGTRATSVKGRLTVGLTRAEGAKRAGKKRSAKAG